MPTLRQRVGTFLNLQARGNDPWLQAALASRYGGSYGTGSVAVNQDSAMRMGALWGCVNLRANVVSSLPIDVYRRFQGLQLEVGKSPFFVTPAPGMTFPEWLYATQTDLDRFGNAFGIITATDGYGLPREIEPVGAAEVTVKAEGRRITSYKIGSTKYEPEAIWHERQHLVAGNPMGLCPITYAAWTIGAYLSSQKFGNDYFAMGATPTGVLQNTAVTNVAGLSDEAKERFKAASAGRDIFVVGKDWTWTPSSAPEAAQAFLDEMRYGAADICRFFGVPATMIDAGTAGSAITYANVTQQNLQWLITSIGPLLSRREAALSLAIPEARFVKFNSDALLRMDPEAASRIVLAKVAGRTLAPSEARELDNRPPFTQDQLDEIELLLPAKTVQPKVETVA